MQNDKWVVRLVKSRTMTMRLAEYIRDNQISTEQVAGETGILEEKLKTDTDSILNATEFLELCAYLSVKPEELK
jgi:DNA-binding Xre family transcriptional regulator